MTKIKNIFTSILTFNNLKTLSLIMFITYLLSDKYNQLQNTIVSGIIYIIIAIILSCLIEFNIIKIDNEYNK